MRWISKMSESAIKYGIGALDRRIEKRKVLIGECRHTDEVNRSAQLLTLYTQMLRIMRPPKQP